MAETGLGPSMTRLTDRLEGSVVECVCEQATSLSRHQIQEKGNGHYGQKKSGVLHGRGQCIQAMATVINKSRNSKRTGKETGSSSFLLHHHWTAIKRCNWKSLLVAHPPSSPSSAQHNHKPPCIWTQYFIFAKCFWLHKFILVSQPPSQCN